MRSSSRNVERMSPPRPSLLQIVAECDVTTDGLILSLSIGCFLCGKTGSSPLSSFWDDDVRKPFGFRQSICCRCVTRVAHLFRVANCQKRTQLPDCRLFEDVSSTKTSYVHRFFLLCSNIKCCRFPPSRIVLFSELGTSACSLTHFVAFRKHT